MANKYRQRSLKINGFLIISSIILVIINNLKNLINDYKGNVEYLEVTSIVKSNQTQVLKLSKRHQAAYLKYLLQECIKTIRIRKKKIDLTYELNN